MFRRLPVYTSAYATVYTIIATVATIAIVATAAVPGATWAAEARQADPDIGARIDRVLAASRQSDQPGYTIIVVKEGATLLRKGYGTADMAAHTPLKPDTVLRIGSITKQFTATAILLLVDEGKIRLDDDITVYLPDYPTRGQQITIEHLLTHTSGIASFTSKPGYMSDMARDVTVPHMIDTFKGDPLDFAPGSRYKYNNSGYFLLGAIIEKVSGQTYDKFVAERIFIPLGMTRTAYEGHERGQAEQAVGYTRTAQGYQPAGPLSMTQPYAAGALVSTVDDLARWDAAVSSGKLLKAASWQRAFTPYVLSTGKSTGYGYGWSVASLRGTPMIAHSGGINGFASYALRLPDEKVYVAVLSNADSGISVSETAYQAAAIAIGKPFPEHQPVKLAAAVLDAYAGAYNVEGEGAYTVRRDGEGLAVQRGTRPPLTVQAYSQSGFFIPGELNTIDFARDAQGRATGFTLHQPTADKVGVRTGDAAAPPQ